MAVTSIRGSTCWTDQAETGSRFLAGSFLLVQTHATPCESSLTPVCMSFSHLRTICGTTTTVILVLSSL